MGDPRVEEAMASGRLPPRVTREELEMSQDVAGITALAEVHHQALRLRPDDGIALASLVVFIPFAALCIELINLGTGRSIAFVRFAIDDATWVRQQIFDSIAHLVYATALVLCRISGLAFYYRICALHKGFLVAIRIIFAVLVIGYLAQMCLIIFHCKPVNMLWAPTSFEDETKFECLEWDEIYDNTAPSQASHWPATCYSLASPWPCSRSWRCRGSKRFNWPASSCQALPSLASPSVE
ncbi:protein related to integral membrane protein pth11 [Hirsutella rhossiliensis]